MLVTQEYKDLLKQKIETLEKKVNKTDFISPFDFRELCDMRSEFANCVTQEEISVREAIKAQKAKDFEVQLQKHREAVAQFYDAYNIPFQFSIEIKENLSGLGYRHGCRTDGCRNGTKRNSVRHVYLLSDFTEGRLKRQKHNFLCSNSTAKGGGNWSDSLGTHGVGDIPTCKKCLELLQIFLKNKPIS